MLYCKQRNYKYNTTQTRKQKPKGNKKLKTRHIGPKQEIDNKERVKTLKHLTQHQYTKTQKHKKDKYKHKKPKQSTLPTNNKNKYTNTKHKHIRRGDRGL